MWWSNSSFSLTGLMLSPASSVCPGKAQGSSCSSAIMRASRSSGSGFHLQPSLSIVCRPTHSWKDGPGAILPLRSPKFAALETGAPFHYLRKWGLMFSFILLCLSFPLRVSWQQEEWAFLRLTLETRWSFVLKQFDPILHKYLLLGLCLFVGNNSNRIFSKETLIHLYTHKHMFFYFLLL